MKLSIVTTLYHSEKHIEEFYRRASGSAKELVGDDYEIILVNDGSPDNSLDIAIELSTRVDKLTVIDLSRNFGHHKAMLAGLSHASGEKIFLIDSDLEEEPEWLIEFNAELERESCDMVSGVQTKHKGGWFERFSGWIIYKIFNSLTGLALPENPVTARIMTRRYLDALLLHREEEISIGGLFLITGFNQRAVAITKHDTSESNYNFTRKMAVMIDSITSFSSKLLVAIFYIGFILVLLAGAYLVYLVLNWMFFSTPLTGWTSVMESIWLLGGLIVLFIGVVGIYLAKVFTETKQRPNSIVRRLYASKDY